MNQPVSNDDQIQPAPAAGNFTEGAVHSHLIKLTGYMLLGFISIMTASLMETVYIGQVGTKQLAAISFTFPLVMIMQAVAMGLSVGASSVVARIMGVGDTAKAKLLNTHCIVLVLSLTALLGVLVYFNLERFFTLLGAEGEVLDLTLGYMRVWLLGMPFFTITLVGMTLMRAMGDAVTPGYLMTIGSSLHIVIAPFFIFGLMGVPEMGLKGAAVSFIIARTVSFLSYAYVMIIRDNLLTFEMRGFFSSCRDISHVGLPAVASNLIAPVSMSVITRLLAEHGAVVVAGFGIASRIESMIQMIIFALSISLAPFVGQNWGAGYFERVKLALRLANWFAMAWGVFAYIVLVLSARTLVSLINNDPEVIEAAVYYLLIVPLGMGFMGVMANANSGFNALGKPLPPLLISILQMIVIYIPLALIGDYLLGYVGIFIASAITVSVLGAFSWQWINKTVYRSSQHGRIHST
ncbi:MAG: MATE family efflux transporter [Gammaproteobacteria bacterium]|nr:MATE family efflux transporter [Gammaproteobacteria bacterium]MBT5204923.1 MATE family efflux transporter [Gammaproteobacteria bacterium]MBT5600882.1 MATE family efflux transporter [Gammaproteobacteria bacterium]MBT6247209.1 MATE family efflux transporter [Gammaproteobacteria bacterium]